MLLERLFELTADDRNALVFPFTHIGGAVWLFTSLLTGARLVCTEALANVGVPFPHSLVRRHLLERPHRLEVPDALRAFGSTSGIRGSGSSSWARCCA